MLLHINGKFTSSNGVVTGAADCRNLTNEGTNEPTDGRIDILNTAYPSLSERVA